jgi:malonyl-CoA O-methyltransferase
MRRYGHRISENIHLYALPPLAEAGRRLGRNDYLTAVDRSLDYYLKKPDLLEFKFLTHFYGYVLEALVDLGRVDLARVGLQPVIDAQRGDGMIPAVPGAAWVCSPGALQMAIVGYKLGLLPFANAAMDYLQPLQLPSGGLLGSYGPGADYGPNGELSWGCKYFLDACHWRMRASFAQQRDRFQADVPLDDPRRQPVLDALGDLAGRRVLEVGCGKGRFLRLLHERYPTAELWGVDVAEQLLTWLPPGVQGRVGSMLNLPFDEGSFDAVLCIEALEHAVRIERAVAEMSRVLKPTGQIVIVDKSIDELGVLPIEAWEQWFDPRELAALLERHGLTTSVSAVASASHDPASALRIWRGTRVGSGPSRASRLARSEPLRAGRARVLARYRRSGRRARAGQLADEGFASYKRGDLLQARRRLLRAVALHPRWLANRGVVSIVVQSLVGRSLKQGAGNFVRYARGLVKLI